MRLRDLAAIGVLGGAIAWGLYVLIGATHMMPAAAALEAEYVDHAWDAMMKLTLPIFGLCLATIIVALLRFRVPDADTREAAPVHASRGGLVEAAWILASLGLTLGLAAYGTREFRLIRGDDHADLDVQVTAVQWSWDFTYPATNTVGQGLLLPRGKRVRLIMQARDVVHSFWVPEFRLKQDIVPGRISKLLFTPTVVGEYMLRCSELCGRDHTVMTAKVRVLEPEDFEKALKAEW